MSEIVLKTRPEARDLIEEFAAEYPDQSEVEVSKGSDGGTLVSLIVQNTPMIVASLSLLIGTIKGREIVVKVTHEGVEFSIGEDR